jgi:polar amino acid transport system substrate-binding protein
MKKSSAWLLVILLASAVLLTACGGSKQPAPAGEGSKQTETKTDDSLERVKKAGKLVVAIDATYPPMEFIEGDKPVGFDVDLAEAVAKKLGVKAEFVVADWNGILTGLQAKRYDVIMSSMSITPERQQQANFVQYFEMSEVFVTKPGIAIKSEKDLAGKIVAVQAETTAHNWVEKLKKESVRDIKEIRSFGSGTETLLELKNNRADVVVIEEPVGLYYAKKDPANYVVTGRAMEPEPIGVAIRKEDVALQKAIEQAVKDVRADGTYKQISEKWFGKELGK